MWHIISIGDEAYLFKIFQFLAMLSSPGTSLYAKIGLLGGLIGIMLMAVQLITSNGHTLNFSSVAIGAVAFMIMFGQTTSVVLEDYHTGRTDVVDGVPLGTAIVGYFVSQGGVGITELFQAGTAVPGHETLGPDYALTALAATRALTDNSLCAGGNTTACAFSASVSSYINDCVLPQKNGVDQAAPGWWSGDPRQAADALSSMEVDNTFLVTSSLITPAGYGVQESVSCKEAYALLQSAKTRPDITDAIASVLLAAAHQNPAAVTPGAATAEAVTVIQNALASINDGQGATTTPGGVISNVSAGATDAQNMMMNAVIAHAMTDAQMRGHSTPGDASNAAIVESAAQRRDVSFAAEQSMFGRTMNATITFFEGLIYGLAPFVAFLIPMGPLGFKFFGRYLSLLLWIFLWMPLMSFVNLFEVMSVLRQMNALAPSRGMGPLTSMVGILQTQYSVGDWIAMGGWLSASVVGISGMIVFGSVAAFQQVAGAAHGPDSVDPSSLAPEAVSSAPIVHMGGVMANTAGEGTYRRGAGFHSFDLGVTAQNSFRHGQQLMAARSSALSATLSHNAQALHSVQEQNALTQTHGTGTSASAVSGISATRGSTDSASGTQTFQSTQHDGFTKTSTTADQKAVSGSTAVGLGGNAGVAKASLGVGVTATGTSTDATQLFTGHGTDQGRGLTKQVGENAAEQKDVASRLSKDTLERMAHNESFAESMGYSSSDAKAIQSQASSLLQARETFVNEQSIATSVGMHEQLSEQTYAHNLSANPEQFHRAVSEAQQLNPQRFQQLQDQFAAEDRYGDRNQSTAAAAGVSLYEAMSSGRTDQVRAEASSAFMQSAGYSDSGVRVDLPSTSGKAAMGERLTSSYAPNSSSVDAASGLRAPSAPPASMTGEDIRRQGAAIDASTSPDAAHHAYDANVKSVGAKNENEIQEKELVGMQGNPLRGQPRTFDQ